ncbi:MAG TPA: 4'-phosphopantetheinyl transferase superfamily protein [Nitrospiraceae bacterium]|nr:4'-phosphopantetheinyl transferase superfamily protein [Nitrospiraceae bacterium]
MTKRSKQVVATETDVPLPDARSVHLWTADVRMFRPVLRRFTALLSPEERKRAARLADPEHRMHFILTHGFLRLVLSRYLHKQPQLLRFQPHANGKPRLVNNHDSPRLEFNLAHSGHMTMIAVANGRPVGVDVEALTRPVRAQAIVERYFTPAERAHFGSLPRSRSSKEFIRYWTAKEAVLKAIGVGLAGGLSRCEVIIHPGGRAATVRLVRQDKPRSWLVRFFPLSAIYLGAVAAEGAGWQVRRYRPSLRLLRRWLDEQNQP